MDAQRTFPQDFVWACTTTAYQVEGAANEDGRGPSIWDTFSHTPGRIAMDFTGDVATDHYHRYKEDVGLMKWLGVKACRLSISWPRVFPQGSGPPNEKGFDFYNRLVDELLGAGIDPWITLFHWDLPQAMEDRFGGWESRDTVACFGDYVGAVAQRLSDRVTHYFTTNEFGCFTDAGYGSGQFAPGKTLARGARNQVRHHGLLAHGTAVEALRANGRRPLEVGLAENPAMCVPVIETDEHIAAARRAMRNENAHFLTTVLEGAYPDSYLEAEGPDAPAFTPDDMTRIGAELDFVGLNMYAPRNVRAADNEQGYVIVPHPPSYPRLDMPWLHLGPTIAYWGPRFVKELWDVKAVVISENGCAVQDQLTTDKAVYDTDRVLYLRAHLDQASRAVADGWPLRGYFLWGLLDNFEWCWGYLKRFGIFYTNYETLERIPKLSATFYREVIRHNAVV